MRIKKYFMQFFLLVIAVLFSGLLAPASADFKKVNERELARTNASLTGQIGTIICPDPEDANKGLEKYDCVAIPAKNELVANEDSLSSVYEDYGYDWWQNRNTVGDVYYYATPFGSAITVESGCCGFCGVDSQYVRIGLGSQEVSLNSWEKNVTLGSKAAEIAGQEQILGTLYLAGLTVKTNGSSYATLCIVNGKPAIYAQVDVTIDRIDLATLSWGDADGCAEEHDDARNPSKAGYVGLKNTSITNVTASGSVAIEVGRISDGQELSIAKSVHIGIDNMNVGISSLDTTVVLGDKKDFSGAMYVLGTLYMKDLKMVAGGYLDIYNPADKDNATSLGLRLNVPLLTLDTLSWGDSDGVAGLSSAGYAGLRNLAINNLAIAGVVTIQTITVQAGDTDTYLPAGTALVRIGLNNMDVRLDSLNTEVALGQAKDNLNQVLGIVYLGGLKTDIKGSVDIHTPSPSTQGIVFDLNIKPTKVHMDALSWGDTDGITGDRANGGGFRGWRNAEINGLTVRGAVSVDVATVDSTVTPVSADEQMFAYYKIPLMGASFVHLGIGTGNPNDDPALPGAFEIGINSLSWDVVLDTSRSLDSSQAGILRTFYMSDFTGKVNGWVHVGAH